MKSLFGDRKFYNRVLTIFIPIVIQMAVTNFVSLLDNIMVGALGTESISGVSIVNQFIFIFNLIIFGALSAAGIFTAQYHGSNDEDGIRYTFRFKLMFNIVVSLLCTLVFFLFRAEIINLFIHDDGSVGNIELAFLEAEKYLMYMLIGLAPYAVAQVFASTMKETGETVVPMISSIAAVAVNCALNLVLIFGMLGFPALGVVGAAIATVISRFVELLILVIWFIYKRRNGGYIRGAFASMYVPMHLIRKIIRKGLPLMANEFFWSLAVTMRNQCYSTRGLEVLAANSISTTVSNFFGVVYLAMGASIAIILGNTLGAGDIEGAKSESKKLITFSALLSAGIGLIVAALSGVFPLMYDVEPEVRSLATVMLVVTALLTPVYALSNSTYYTIRSGGKIFTTVLLDSAFMWSIVVPVSLILAHFSSLDIVPLFIICQCTEMLKVVLGFILLKKSNWANRMVAPGENAE